MKAIHQRVQELFRTLKNFNSLTLTLSQGQIDGWVGVFLKALLLVNIHTKYESNLSRGSRDTSKCWRWRCRRRWTRVTCMLSYLQAGSTLNKKSLGQHFKKIQFTTTLGATFAGDTNNHNIKSKHLHKIQLTTKIGALFSEIQLTTNIGAIFSDDTTYHKNRSFFFRRNNLPHH